MCIISKCKIIIFYKWIDSNKDDEINSFKECIDSYIYFKKDAFYKTNKLIKKKPKFNAPKLLKIVLLLFSRDVQKISLARETLKSISTDEVNDYFLSIFRDSKSLD